MNYCDMNYIEILKDDNKKLESRIKVLEREIYELTIEDSKNSIGKLTIIKKLENENDMLQREIDDTMRILDDTNHVNKELIDRNEELEKEIEEHQAKANGDEKLLRHFARTCNELNRDNEALKIQVHKLIKEIDYLNDYINDLEKY